MEVSDSDWDGTIIYSNIPSPIEWNNGILISETRNCLTIIIKLTIKWFNFSWRYCC